MNLVTKNVVYLMDKNRVSPEELNEWAKESVPYEMCYNLYEDTGTEKFYNHWELIALKGKFNVSIDDLLEMDLEAMDLGSVELSDEEVDILMANLSACAYEVNQLKALEPDMAVVFDQWAADYEAELEELGKEDGRYSLLSLEELKDEAGRLRGEMLLDEDVEGQAFFSGK